MPKKMWQPSQSSINNSQMMHFINKVNNQHGLALAKYNDLYHWSIEHKNLFWQDVWQFCGIKASKQPEKVFIPGESMWESSWCPGARLNFAENLLQRRDNKIAVISNNEKQERRTLTFAELYKAVAKVAAYFKSIGLEKNHRVASVLPNIPETIISMLATTSMGAIWSSCSPDFGIEGLLDRFQQIKPSILVICDGYYYHGQFFSCEEKIKWLQAKIPSLKKIILVKNAGTNISMMGPDFNRILSGPDVTLNFAQLPFDHPVYIMYSSGTTGLPKCIVHGAGGTLLQHLKELVLHTDLTANDIIFYYTTAGWMMWNWYVSSLAVGATVIQYDGAPLYPTSSCLPDFIEKENITIFGTSAKYLSALEKNNFKVENGLTVLRTILSTGSPLVPKNFDYVYNHIKSEVCLSSISGGTDIISCFALGNPILPVYRGELQCIGLGMNVEIYNEQGESVINQKGELVCTDSFPSMPVYFWHDKNGEKYHQAYFSKYKGVWAHGDFAEITDRSTMIIYGRSDATLNPGGVRIGTAEIYRQVEKFSEITDMLAVSQEWEDDSRVILFVILKQDCQLTEDLQSRIKLMIRNNSSPRHVPAKIIAVPDIPRTLSGKTMELAVREIIHGKPIKNISAIANPESLDYFRDLAVLRE